MVRYLPLIPLGFIIGAYGTLIGAGGGFVLVPLLLLLYPKESPDLITSVSLAVVFFNALSGSWAYERMKRIDYTSGLLFSAATVPGAILGALTTAVIPRRIFDGVFGLLMIVASAYLLWRPHNRAENDSANRPNHVTRSLIDADGISHTFSYNPAVGLGLSFFVGYVSSFLGVGGGFIHVPALVHFLNFPVHVATATSHFMLAIMALTGTIVHIVTGVFAHGVLRTAALAVGVIPGAQLGAWLSNRLHGDWIIRSLAVALGVVGIRVLMLVF